MMEIFEYPFMRAALVMGLVLGTLFSLMGVFVVTRGMAFFSDFIAHSAILGGGLAMIAQIEPSVFLIIYSLVIALAISAVWHMMPLSRDTVLGVFYGGAVAFGVILISVKGLGQSNLIQFLFGDILLISPLDIWLTIGLLVVFVIFLKFKLKHLIKSSFLPEISMAEGIRVRFYDYVLIALVAVTIALSIKMVGVILANAMVVIPAATAKTVSRNFKQFMLIAPVIGVGSFVGGTIMSFYVNLPSGPSVIALAFGCFLVSMLFKGSRVSA